MPTSNDKQFKLGHYPSQGVCDEKLNENWQRRDYDGFTIC
jgi:hypothetical protein